MNQRGAGEIVFVSGIGKSDDGFLYLHYALAHVFCRGGSESSFAGFSPGSSGSDYCNSNPQTHCRGVYYFAQKHSSMFCGPQFLPFGDHLRA